MDHTSVGWGPSGLDMPCIIGSGTLSAPLKSHISQKATTAQRDYFGLVRDSGAIPRGVGKAAVAKSSQRIPDYTSAVLVSEFT